MAEMPEIILDENDLNESTEVEAKTTPSESSAEETKAPVEGESKTEESPDSKDSDKPDQEIDSDSNDEADDAPEVAAEESDDQPKKGAEARKEQLQTEIRNLVAQRNQQRQEIAEVNAKAYQPQTAQELVDEGLDPLDARIQAMEQRTQMAEYNAHVADLNANLNIESLQVMSDFPVFNPNAPEYNEGLAKLAADTYTRSAQTQTDPRTGMIIQANVLPYDIYKSFASAHASGAQNGQVKAQQSVEKMMAASDTPSSSAPKQEKVDPFLVGLTRGMKL